MTAGAFLFLSIALVIAVVDWLAVSIDNRVLEYIFKPLTMVALVCVALCLASGASGRALQNQMPASQVLALQAVCYGALGALGIVPFFSPLTL